MPLIALPPPMAKALDTGRSFLDWWLRELWTTVPTGLKARIRGRARTELRMHEGAIEILRQDGETRTVLRADRTLDALDQTAWDEIAGSLIDRDARLYLRSRDILCLELEVPRASGRDMPSAIALQLELASPLKPALITWSWAPIEVEREKTRVLVALTRTSLLEMIDGLFTLQGLPCPAIHCDTPSGTMLLRRSKGRLQSTARKWERRALLWPTLLFLSVPLLLLGCATVLGAFNQAQLESLRREAAPKLDALREARRNARLWQAYIPLRSKPSATSMLSELGERVPEGASVENVDYSGERGIRFELSGQVNDGMIDYLVHSPGKLEIIQPSDPVAKGGNTLLSAELR